MQKFMQACTLAFLAFLTVGQIYFPASPLMMLTSSAPLILALRAVIVLGVLILTFTRPPRTFYMRCVLGVSASVLLGWAGYQTWEDNLEILDGLVFLTAAVSFGLAALELPAMRATVEVDDTAADRKPVQLPLWS
jgi:hypothetical protein